MTYNVERIAITNYLQSQSFYGITPFGLDGDTVELVAGGGFMTLLSGQAQQISVGAPSANLHGYPGVLAITIVGATSEAARTLADAVVEGLTGKKLDETGTDASAGATTIIDFAANGLTPHIASAGRESPFYRVLVNAPFLRTERK